MTSSISLGAVENMSLREMKIEQEISRWNDVFYEDVGRITGVSPIKIKNVFIELVRDFLNPVGKNIRLTDQTKFRQFERGHATLMMRIGENVLILDMRQPQRHSVITNSSLEVGVYGTFNVDNIAAGLRQSLKDHIRESHEEVTWIYNDGGHVDEVVFPLKKYREIMPEVYPFVSNDLNAWVDKFLASDSNILILNGPMGTGKSSLIAHIINRGKMSAMTAFDDKVMKNDSLYTNFISWSQNLLVLEDADLLLLGRVDKDNDTMSKLLNVSEGIIDTRGKKIIFTANLGNTKDIDPALLRPGRCYDIVEFRELTKAEANVARAKLGKRLFERDKNYSLAQVYQAE